MRRGVKKRHREMHENIGRDLQGLRDPAHDAITLLPTMAKIIAIERNTNKMDT